ncbi:hypothetical protein FRC03_012218 [Tulasnella sp. 419]|nr:hypothetical protein FRC03_012218 [Tulasnella sp. 419]
MTPIPSPPPSVGTSSSSSKTISGWRNQVLFVKMLDAFKTLIYERPASSTDADNIEARGCALFGPKFRKSTFYNYHRRWINIPEERQGTYNAKALIFTWEMFIRGENALKASDRRATKKQKGNNGIAIVIKNEQDMEVVDLTAESD